MKARRLDQIAKRKLESDFKQLLPLCDLIHISLFSKKRTHEPLTTLIEVRTCCWVIAGCRCAWVTNVI